MDFHFVRLLGSCNHSATNNTSLIIFFFSKSCSSRKGNEDRVYCKPLDSVPVSDQHVALGILLELGVQRGTLQHMLEVVLLLLELWDSGQDNDTDSCFTSAPLIHLLRRFEEITGALHKTLEPNKLAEEVNCIPLAYQFTLNNLCK